MEESILDVLTRQGALKMLTEALEMEVTVYLERRRYERAKAEAKGYRNGRRARQITVLASRHAVLALARLSARSRRSA